MNSSLPRQVLRGLAFGAIATVPMTAAFWAARRAGFLDELPPHKAVRSVAPAIPEPGLSWASAIAHLLVGGVAGATYSVLPERIRGPVTGTVFGLAVWAVGYEGVMPAATEIAPAHRDKRQRALTILVAHVIYGSALGLLFGRTRH